MLDIIGAFVSACVWTSRGFFLRSQGDRANTVFRLSADFSSCFNWNTKQLFVFVMATYSTPRNFRNEVVVWDQIVTDAKDAKIELEEQLNKYPILDDGKGLRGANVKLELRYRYLRNF
eukprot:GHVT01037542.1.p1 GENE.GHVT01037542.1~~GHVT01037542.1.p1  ORF type:complete len:118 (+),score=22.50 GHVT01037542.1:1819-2172(+)